MTQVQMKTTYAGPHGTVRAGGVIELPDEDATALIGAGYAEAYTPPADAEPAGDAADAHDETTSTDGAPENTSRPKPKRKTTRKSGDGEPAGDTPGVDDLLG